MSAMALPTIQQTQLYEPVLKKDIKAGGKVLKAGTVFVPKGSKFDESIIKHCCYMRPIAPQKEN